MGGDTVDGDRVGRDRVGGRWWAGGGVQAVVCRRWWAGGGGQAVVGVHRGEVEQSTESCRWLGSGIGQRVVGPRLRVTTDVVGMPHGGWEHGPTNDLPRRPPSLRGPTHPSTHGRLSVLASPFETQRRLAAWTGASSVQVRGCGCAPGQTGQVRVAGARRGTQRQTGVTGGRPNRCRGWRRLLLLLGEVCRSACTWAGSEGGPCLEGAPDPHLEWRINLLPTLPLWLSLGPLLSYLVP